MRKFQSFLFFYSTAASTILLIGSFFFFPAPQNFITMFLFLPVTGYFWLRVTSPASVNSNKWSLRLLIGVFMLSIIGLYSYWLAVMYQKSEPGKTEVSQTPTNIKELLAQSLQKIDSLEKQNDELSTKIDLLADGQKDVLAKNDQSEEEKIDTGLPLGYLTLT